MARRPRQMSSRQFKSTKDSPILRKKLAARVQTMSKSERAKLDRLLINVELLGDVGKAVGQAGVSKQLVDKWMNTREIAWVIDHALIQAERMAKGEDKTYVFLWWHPEIRNNSLFLAKVASKNLKAATADILQAIENNNNEFFIALGKCLSGEIDATYVDQRDAYLAGLLTRYPSITAKDATDQLTRVGFPRISEENFRMLKKRFRLKFLTVQDHFAPRRELHALAARLGVPVHDRPTA